MITIIDDDDDLRLTLEELLVSRGHEVKSFSRAEEALDQLTGGFRPSLILLDLMMPGMNGWEFREKLESNPALAGIPLVVVTARAESDSSLRALGNVDVLHKPFSSDELMEIVDRPRESSVQ